MVDSGPDSGGGWFLEQWFGRADQLYADNGNGRLAPSTKVLYDSETGVDLLTFVQTMINDGLAVTVGDNPGGQDGFLKMIDPASPAAMTIGTSAALGSVIAALGGGIAPGSRPRTSASGRCPGRVRHAGVQVGGGSLWIVADKGDEQTAAAWDFITYLVSAEIQSRWASETGYVPVRSDSVDIEPLATTYATDPRFKVPYDQLLTSVEGEASLSPVLGPRARSPRGDRQRRRGDLRRRRRRDLTECRRCPVERVDRELQPTQLNRSMSRKVCNPSRQSARSRVLRHRKVNRRTRDGGSRPRSATNVRQG